MKKIGDMRSGDHPADGADPLYLHLRRPHSDGIRTSVCIKNGEFAGKKTI